MSPHESKFCSTCYSFLRNYDKSGISDPIYVDRSLKIRIAEGCDVCSLVYKSMSPELALDFDASEFRLSTTYMWRGDESAMNLYFNEQIKLAESKYIRSVTRLERKFLIQKGK